LLVRIFYGDIPMSTDPKVMNVVVELRKRSDLVSQRGAEEIERLRRWIARHCDLRESTLSAGDVVIAESAVREQRGRA
jgi:hypothetical protein